MKKAVMVLMLMVMVLNVGVVFAEDNSFNIENYMHDIDEDGWSMINKRELGLEFGKVMPNSFTLTPCSNEKKVMPNGFTLAPCSNEKLVENNAVVASKDNSYFIISMSLLILLIVRFGRCETKSSFNNNKDAKGCCNHCHKNKSETDLEDENLEYEDLEDADNA